MHSYHFTCSLQFAKEQIPQIEALTAHEQPTTKFLYEKIIFSH